MNTATLEFPPIQSVAVKPPAEASIKDTVLAQFGEAERTVAALAERYRAVAYDCSTTKGMAEAKAARHDLRENGRFFVTRAETRIKNEVNALKKVMAEEVERIVKIVKPVEDSIDAQIKAREQQIAEEKAERERKESARKAIHETGIQTITGYLALAAGATSEKIAGGIAALEAMAFGESWEEYLPRAIEARDRAVAGLRALHAKTVAAEEEVARLEAQRIENERVAAELQAQREALERQAAELKAKQDAQRAAELAATPPPAPAAEPAQAAATTPEQRTVAKMQLDAEVHGALHDQKEQPVTEIEPPRRETPWITDLALREAEELGKRFGKFTGGAFSITQSQLAALIWAARHPTEKES